jgi:hypothetical protein
MSFCCSLGEICGSQGEPVTHWEDNCDSLRDTCSSSMENRGSLEDNCILLEAYHRKYRRASKRTVAKRRQGLINSGTLVDHHRPFRGITLVLQTDTSGSTGDNFGSADAHQLFNRGITLTQCDIHQWITRKITLAQQMDTSGSTGRTLAQQTDIYGSTGDNFGSADGHQWLIR